MNPTITPISPLFHKKKHIQTQHLFLIQKAKQETIPRSNQREDTKSMEEFIDREKITLVEH